MVYLIHFATPYKRVRHYIGFTPNDLESRMKKHRNGTGSRLMRAVTNAGIEWSVVRVWQDEGRQFERKLKNQKQSSRFCPACKTIHEENHTR